MKLYSSKEHSDEEGPLADTFRLAIIQASQKELEDLCDFFADVKKELNGGGPVHMHFRDHLKQWNSDESIDISVELTD